MQLIPKFLKIENIENFKRTNLIIKKSFFKLQYERVFLFLLDMEGNVTKTIKLIEEKEAFFNLNTIEIAQLTLKNKCKYIVLATNYHHINNIPPFSNTKEYIEAEKLYNNLRKMGILLIDVIFYFEDFDYFTLNTTSIIEKFNFKYNKNKKA